MLLLLGAHLKNAHFCQRDLMDSNWSRVVLPTKGEQRLVLSLFVLQELPALEPVITGLAHILASDDIALILIVAPSYSAKLSKTRNLKSSS